MHDVAENKSCYPKGVKEECHTEFNVKKCVSCETIQLLLSFANIIDIESTTCDC